MKLTVVPSDRLIMLDGVGFNMTEWNFNDSHIHAIQWDGKRGEIEYEDDRANVVFTDQSTVEEYLSEWNDRNDNHVEGGFQQKLNDEWFNIPADLTQDLEDIKHDCILSIKGETMQRLQSTDWYVMRLAEEGKAIPEDAAAYRKAVKTVCSMREEAISLCSELKQISDLFNGKFRDWPDHNN